MHGHEARTEKLSRHSAYEMNLLIPLGQLQDTSSTTERYMPRYGSNVLILDVVLHFINFIVATFIAKMNCTTVEAIPHPN
jgi:hypothetical protein